LRISAGPGRWSRPRRPARRARQQAFDLLADGIDLLAEYQDRLAAQDTYGVLLVLQGLDASGKDLGAALPGDQGLGTVPG
jgi:polyphosphate kinase 2 (PPK2 family)